MVNPTAIFFSDPHIKEVVPLCRTDDYFATQARKVDFIKRLKNKFKIPVFCAGDIFDRWRVSQELESWAITNLPNMYAIPGQHDLAQHSMRLIKKTSFNVLTSSGVINKPINGPIAFNDYMVHFFPYREKIIPLTNRDVINSYKRHVALIHTFTYVGDTWPGNNSPFAKSLLKRLEGYDLIVCGDNHKSFIVEDSGRLLLNPGSMMRSTVDQIDDKPRVYIWYMESNTLEPVYLPIEDGVISKAHLEIKRKKDENSVLFSERIKNKKNIDFDFSKNLEIYFRDNNEPKRVEELIWWSLR